MTGKLRPRRDDAEDGERGNRFGDSAPAMHDSLSFQRNANGFRASVHAIAAQQNPQRKRTPRSRRSDRDNVRSLRAKRMPKDAR